MLMKQENVAQCRSEFVRVESIGFRGRVVNRDSTRWDSDHDQQH